MVRKKGNITLVMKDYPNTRASRARKANAAHACLAIARIDGEAQLSLDSETQSSLDTYSQQGAPLLNLPKEIQNRIFDLVSSNTNVKSKLFGLLRPPGFLLSCKQIYHETVKTFYNCATFQFNDLNLFRSWLRAVNYEHLDLVKRLSICGSFVRIEEGRLATEKQQRPFIALEGGQWYGGDEIDRHNYMGKSMRRRIK